MYGGKAIVDGEMGREIFYEFEACGKCNPFVSSYKQGAGEPHCHEPALMESILYHLKWATLGTTVILFCLV